MRFKKIRNYNEIKPGHVYFETLQNDQSSYSPVINTILIYNATSKAGFFHSNDEHLRYEMSFEAGHIWDNGKTKSKYTDHVFLSDCGVPYEHYKKYNNHKLYELIEGDIKELGDMSIKDFEYWAEEQTMWNNIKIGW